MKKATILYPNLTNLGISISDDPVSHVLVKDLERNLSKGNIVKFHEYFGVQTCPLVESGPAVYPWDAEAVLERIFNGKLIGSQANWD